MERDDLVRLRRARNQVDREYASPLDVPALARTAAMSAGHFSRRFRAYCETPYRYLKHDSNHREDQLMADTKKSDSKGFTAAERAAMKERARELKAEERSKKDRATGEQDLQTKIAEMPKSDRTIAERIHAVVTANAPQLMPKTWYGMPAYANADGKIVCFFQAAAKFDARYATFGFNDAATLDDGSMWPTSWALTKLTAADEKRIGELVRKASS